MTVDDYKHAVASHCESGSVRNLLAHGGLQVSEPMIFGIGSGPAFYYLFFARGPSGLPLVGIRMPPGKILRNFGKLCGIEMFAKQYRSTDEALEAANALIDEGIPFAISVDMFYMKYLPSFLHVHAPFHFIIVVGREGDRYSVSDPYSEEIAQLDVEDLRLAWETHAPLSRDNSMFRVLAVPEQVDWIAAAKKAIAKTCKNMLMPPVVRNIFWFVGIEGMRAYSKKLREWPDQYAGVKLREGILMSAVAFEDQGTGGGAFRLMYGAFLQELANLAGSSHFGELADRMIEHGRFWRDTSRMMIKAGKTVPMDDDAFADWIAENRGQLDERLAEIGDRFARMADFEAEFFADLRAAGSTLGRGD